MQPLIQRMNGNAAVLVYCMLPTDPSPACFVVVKPQCQLRTSARALTVVYRVHEATVLAENKI